MKYLTSSLFVICVLFSSFGHAQQINPNNLPPCPKPDYSKKTDVERTAKWTNCWGRYKVELTSTSVFNGNVLEGEWIDGTLNGKGSYYYLADNILKGNKYVGDFKDGKENGQGTFTRANGDKYVGEFKDGVENGQGTLTYADGTKLVGEFRNGSMTFGTFTNKYGDKYVGEYNKGNRVRGTFTSAEGDIYVGEWKGNKRSGLGINYHTNGRIDEGIWEDDKFIREAKVNLPALKNNVASNTDRSDIDRDRQQFAEDRRKSESNTSKLPPCPKPDYSKTNDHGIGGRTEKWHNCYGRYVIELTASNKGDEVEGEWRNGLLNGKVTYNHNNNGGRYVGEFKDGQRHGLGTFFYLADNQFKGDIYFGEYENGVPKGQGILFKADGRRIEGIWENYNFIRAAKVNLPPQNNNIATNTDRNDIDRERQQLAEERRRLEDEKRQRQQASSSQRINLQINHTQPNNDGLFFIDIKTNADTASLQIDGKEEGGKSDGNYTLKRIARAGQSSSFKIVATDIYGNTDTKTINVTRTISEAKATYADLNPTNIKRKSDRDAVAIIIGIADYKNLPKADFANDDARVFYDYAIRALSIKPENIKLLVDGDASEVGIYKAFKTWLPSKVKSSTDVYVFYSGHGLPTSDGKGLYLLPQQTDRDLISKTAIQMQEVISDIQSTKPKSVTLFLDACYSGQSRTGETLIASARPISIKSESRIFPDNFTVITASQNDQISSSNPDLKHGIFSYYLMRGMEGDADTDKDGKITLGEMQSYLVENVGRQAGMMNRKQEPQLIGDADRVLVGR